jgi:hypothetical protein
MKIHYSLMISTGIAILFSACSSVQEPAYRVLEKRDGYEVRSYQPYIVAETKVKGEHDEALNRGFRRLFKYIDGANTGSRDIPMTAPVIAEPDDTSEKIPMTAPVIQEKTGNSHLVSFVMPEGSTIKDLPEPTNPDIVLREVPARDVAVLSYSWYAGEKKIMNKVKELLTYLEKDGVAFKPGFQSARYDPPWTPPFMRRNEIFIELK